jgi:nucleotide-binding universal stress UspA family protein
LPYTIMAKHIYSHILLFAEGSEEGMHAARDAIALAADEKARLRAAAVVDTSTLKHLLTSRIFIQDEMEDFEKELEVSANKHLNWISQLSEEAGVTCDTVLLRGACHAVLLREQRDCRADLFVMGAFKASAARRDLMAREKQLILEDIACPALLVR